MKIDYLIGKLKEQLQKIHQSDTEVWFKTTYALLLDYFPSYSPRASNFNSLISDFKIKSIYVITPAQANDLKSKAVEYLNEIIQYLTNLQETEKQEAIQKANMLRLMVNEPELWVKETLFIAEKLQQKQQRLEQSQKLKPDDVELLKKLRHTHKNRGPRF